MKEEGEILESFEGQVPGALCRDEAAPGGGMPTIMLLTLCFISFSPTICALSSSPSSNKTGWTRGKTWNRDFARTTLGDGEADELWLGMSSSA